MHGSTGHSSNSGYSRLQDRNWCHVTEAADSETQVRKHVFEQSNMQWCPRVACPGILQIATPSDAQHASDGLSGGVVHEGDRDCEIQGVSAQCDI